MKFWNSHSREQTYLWRNGHVWTTVRGNFPSSLVACHQLRWQHMPLWQVKMDDLRPHWWGCPHEIKYLKSIHVDGYSYQDKCPFDFIELGHLSFKEQVLVPSLCDAWKSDTWTNIFLLNISRVRLISLAAQKFISDIANDALQHCKMRGSGQSSRKSGKVRFICMFCFHYVKYYKVLNTFLSLP